MDPTQNQPPPVVSVANASPPVQAPTPQVTQQENTDVPEEIKGWSWGGFLWTWIWAIGNKTWIGLLALLPIGNVIMPFVLGIFGREWAWKNNTWDSVDDFKKTQRNWVKWWLIIILPLSILSFLGVFFMSFVLVALNPAAQIQKADDTAKTAESILLLSATAKYFATNNMFPWNSTPNQAADAYTSNDVSKETWLAKLVSSGNLDQKFVDKLESNDYRIKVFIPKYTGGDVVDLHYCFQPESDMVKLRAKSSCQATTNQELKSEFCTPGSEYLCLPDLVPQASPTP